MRRVGHDPRLAGPVCHKPQNGSASGPSTGAGRVRQPEDPGQAGRSENPTDSANLTVSSIPVSINMSARGTLALGVVGPAGTIAVAHLVGFPVGATLVICILQIVAAVVNHNWRH